MKISHLFFLIAISLFAACKDDEGGDPSSVILSHDGVNLTGPMLDAGEHELAVRFPASTMAEHTDKKITEVEVFVGQLPPQTCLIRLYGPGTNSTPGTKFYEGNVTSSINPGGWNTFKITPAITLTGEDLWIGVNVTHAVQQQSIGCDAGPRNEGGDWLFNGLAGDWKTYVERTNESVNWNIRGVVE